jgi:hypothetical protein
MAWAIASTPEDLTELETALNTAGMTAADRNSVNRYVQAGFQNWRNAPFIGPEHPCFATDGPREVFDPVTGASLGVQGMRYVVITNGTLAEFRALMTTLSSKYTSAIMLTTYRRLLALPWYGIPEFPIPEGYFDGMTCT